MVQFRIVLMAAVLSMALLISACGGGSSETGADSDPTAEAVVEEEAADEEAADEEAADEEAADEEAADEEAADEEAADEEAADEEAADEEAAEEEIVSEEPLEEVDYDNFDDPTAITNEWNPLTPGTQWVHEGITTEDGERIPRRIEFTVTDLTKEIEGVRTVVAWIEDYADGEVVEQEIAFYAQDNDGNIWYFGEYPAEYEDGEFIEAKPWIPGLDGGLAGIAMQADPQPDTPSYSQGWGPAVEWTDRGVVHAMGEETCVAFDCYEDVLIISEYNQEEPDVFQTKYFARGVGNVQVGFLGDDPNKEELELIDLRQLSPEELAEVHEAALALEEQAYEISEMYGQTSPLE